MMDQNEMKEFASFMKCNLESPRELDETLTSHITRDLNPSLPRVIGKLFLFHLLGSFVTLLLCPQFGISITKSQGVMPYLMGIHPALCFIACGMIWMLIGQLLTFAFLTWDEQRVIG